MNKMEKEMKMRTVMMKVQEQTISEQKVMFNNVTEKLKTGLIQSEKKQKKMKEGEKAEERDAGAVYGIQLSLHEDAKREREDWMPTGAEEGAGKATVAQRLNMLLEQTTDSRDREESEWPVSSCGGTGAGQPGEGGVSLPVGPTAMERLMSAVSGSLGQVAYETAHVHWMPHIYKLHIPIQLSQQFPKTGLKQKQAWTLSKIQGVYGDKILADLSDYRACREVLGDIEEKCCADGNDLLDVTIPKGICGGAAVRKHVPQEFSEGELSFFLYCYTLLNYYRAEAVKRKEEMKKLHGVICSCDILTLSSGTVFREITYSELESLLRARYPQMQQALSQQSF
ncbi:uncharacterized protein MONOS_17604 [Monocercomonoides exilis]|uniref:uncharacterized protein n=1 Tax=Monocercomonoides exilis TaxID=2049356 RepID=UPI00355993AA|nr:hypothetical protein MONOS_17604 [Monocercomonoides exilis]